MSCQRCCSPSSSPAYWPACSTTSSVGVLLAVGVAVRLPTWVVKLYIGVLVLAIGLVILKNSARQPPFSWRRIGVLGFVAAFNKGISGGGYGPVVTGGQMLAGVRSRSAIGIASLAEGLTSVVGLMVYLASGTPFPWLLAPSLLLGAVLSVPLAAYVVSLSSSAVSPRRWGATRWYGYWCENGSLSRLGESAVKVNTQFEPQNGP